MLTPEDKQKFKNKETLLNELRSKRLERQSNSQGDGRTPNVSEVVRRAIPTGDTNDREVESEGRRETQSVYGGNERSTNGAGSSSRFADQLRSVSFQPSGSDSSTNQSNGTATKSRVERVQGVFNKYKEALKTGGKPKTTATPKVSGKKLSDVEAIKLRPKLINFVMWQSEHLDQFIIATTRGHDTTIIIWSDITEPEAEILVDFWIARAKVNAQAAQAIRYASVMMDRIRLGLIIVPRMYRTFITYMERGFSIR